MDTTEELPTVISFCSGYGGIERGLDLAGLEHRVIAYVEIEAFAIANLVNKMEDGIIPPAPIYTDIKTFPAHLFRGAVDLITGGYPCQPFSAAGKRRGTDDPRHLWPYIREHIEAIGPSRCFFENVEGHISLGLREVISDLEGTGYQATWGIFSAREVGAPHQRKRVYILADTNNTRNSAYRRSIDGYRSKDEQGRKEQSQFKPDGHNIAPELADTSGEGLEGPHDYAELPERVQLVAAKCGTDDEGSELADSDSTRLRQSDQEDARQSSEQSDSGGFQSGNAANANSEGLEGRLQRGSVDTQGRQEQEVRYAAQRSNWRGGRGHSTWPSEPGVGRVVDGCANRVDRIRLLGNGVVPQTAAKAWTVLNNQL